MDEGNPYRVFNDLTGPMYPRWKPGVIYGKLRRSFTLILYERIRAGAWDIIQFLPGRALNSIENNWRVNYVFPPGNKRKILIYLIIYFKGLSSAGES
jgi:hypothetical protein